MSEAINPDFVSILSRILENGATGKSARETKLTFADEFTRIADRVCVIANSKGADEFRAVLKAALGSAWEKAFGFDAAHLSEQKRLTYEFALGGFVAVLAYRAQSGNNCP